MKKEKEKVEQERIAPEMDFGDLEERAEGSDCRALSFGFENRHGRELGFGPV